MKKLPISFGGANYRGTNTVFCVFCKKPIYEKYVWVIYENTSGNKINLCERHYKEWETKKESAFMIVSDEFRGALNALNDGNKYA